MDRFCGYLSKMRKLIEIFNDIFSNADFLRVKNDFFLEGQGVVIVINLQKSSYDNIYFVNIGIWINVIGGCNNRPKENACHIKFRADTLLPIMHPDIDFGRMFVGNIESNQEREVYNSLSEYMLPLVRSISSLDSVKIMFKQGYFNSALVRKEARDLLNV